MRRIRHTVFGGLISLAIVSSSWADTSFVVKDIRIVGLSGISKGTVLNYMPITVGETMTPEKSNQILKALYDTGFFTNVSLGQEGNTLVVRVSESATIANVKMTGNKAIKTEDLQKVLTHMGIASSNVYNMSALNELKESLQQQYYGMGYYNAHVDYEAKPIGANRVNVNITINEGKVAKIKKITIVGNHVFSSFTLVRQFDLTTPRPWSFLTKSDEYSEQKLNASLEKLRSYYMDHGYIRFRVDSKDVALSPDKRSVNIIVYVTEGPQYRFSGYSFSGRTLLPPEILQKSVTFFPGRIYSQDEVEKSVKAIGFALGDKGYAFARVEPIPTIDDQAKTVAINFNIDPGVQVYVRRIIYKGNTVTADYVLRRSMQQMEGAQLSSRKVQESVRSLNLLGYFKNVNVNTVPVPGTTNQVDLVYDVNETPAGQANVSLGYGTLGFELGAGINQANFLGTGKTVGANFDRTNYATTYSVNYYDPYFTVNNIGMGITGYYTTTRPGNANLSRAYAYDSTGVNLNFNIPLNLHNTLQAGVGYRYMNIRTFPCDPVAAAIAGNSCTPVPNEITNFINNNGNVFNNVTFNLGWAFNSLDRAIFPTQGFAQSLSGTISAPVFANRVDYYLAAYGATFYYPLNRDHTYVVELRGGTGYGNGYGETYGLPFFLNYYAGGLSQGLNRAFEQNSLGPKDSNHDPIGGNLLVYAGANFIFPSFISPDTVRTSLFIDAANVYQTKGNSFVSYPAESMRFSAGIGIQWRSPMGPLEFSLAAPLNKKHGDQVSPFQFTMGTSF